MAHLTLAQRVQRLPSKYCSSALYTDVMRAPSDLRIANRLQRHWASSVDERRRAMCNMALAINALRRAERAAGLAI